MPPFLLLLLGWSIHVCIVECQRLMVVGHRLQKKLPQITPPPMTLKNWSLSVPHSYIKIPSNQAHCIRSKTFHQQVVGWSIHVCIVECQRLMVVGHHLQKKLPQINPPHDFKELVPFCTPQLHKNSIQPSTLHPIKDLSSTSNTCKPSQVFCNTEIVSPFRVSFPVTYWLVFSKKLCKVTPDQICALFPVAHKT